MTASTLTQNEMFYVCGWNDTEYGIKNWTGSDKWSCLEHWLDYMRTLAQTLLANGEATQNYLKGVIDAVDQYLQTKVVGRK